ncbi:MAG: hypothetical protein IKE01_04265 [Clostridia bacterium]|nr:hypothetical protein [Clostridia bacterium]
MEINIENEIQGAIYDIARLVSNNEEQAREIVQMLNKTVTINYVGGAIAGTSHAAETTPSIEFQIGSNNEVRRVCKGITITLPRNITNINHFRISCRHEFFHAIANLFNNSLSELNPETNTVTSNAGGKIEERDVKNIHAMPKKISPASVLFNELVTDLSAYCSYYPKANISINSILNGDGLDEINRRYGMGDGYRQLFPLGLCIIKAFSNEPCNYDELDSNMYEAQYSTNSGSKEYVNELFQGVLFNPLGLKKNFIEYTSQEEWNKLEEVADRIMKNFKSNLSVKYGDVLECTKIMAEYLIEKCERATDPKVKDNLVKIIKEYNALFDKARAYYKKLDKNDIEIEH